MMRRRAFAALVLGSMLAAGCDSTTDSTPGEGVVVFTFDASPADTMRVLVRDPATLEEARRFVAGTSQANIPAGPIVRGSGIDPRYPFHFIPDSVRLVEAAVEVCDGAPMKTPAEVEEYFRGTGNPGGPRAPWCPWGARPLAVE